MYGEAENALFEHCVALIVITLAEFKSFDLYEVFVMNVMFETINKLSNSHAML